MALYSTYDNILFQTLVERYKTFFVTLLVIVCLLIVEIVYWFREKNNRGISIWEIIFGKTIRPNHISLKQQITRKIIAIAVLLFIMIWWAIPVYNDISQDQYIQVDAIYSRSEQTSQRNLFSNGHVYIEVAETVITLQLPADWASEDFPKGTYWGKVWYSEESQIILDFSPIVGN